MTRREMCLRASAIAAEKNRRPLSDRFEEKTQPEPNSGCLLWLGAVGRNGYGKIGHEGRAISAHRVAYELRHGRVEGEDYVLHRCDNRICVNADHLFLGTHADNMADKKAKGRCPLTSRLTAAQVSELRALRAGGAKLDELAARFQVTKSYVCILARWRANPRVS